MWDRISPKPAGPRLSLAQPWATNPKPKVNLSNRFGQPRAFACCWNFNIFLTFSACPDSSIRSGALGQTGSGRGERRGARDAQLAHAEDQSCAVETKPYGCTLRAAYDPIGFLKGLHNMLAFNVSESGEAAVDHSLK